MSNNHLNADLVVAMAGQHAWDLGTLGVSPERLRLLRTFDSSNPSHVDVDDPFYRPYSQATTCLSGRKCGHVYLPGHTPPP